MRPIIIGIILLVFVGGLGIWIGSREPNNSPPREVETSVPAPTASVSDAFPKEEAFDKEGIILIDSAPSANRVAYILYREPGLRNRVLTLTKRLVFPSEFACEAGDMPCTFAPGALPVKEGDAVRVIGVRVSDTVRIERLILL